jgi:predicted NBD/HSP70 family sugar kinase
MAKKSGKYNLQNGILRRLYFQHTQSCAELSRWLDKSIPLIARALNELMHAGYVVASGYAPSTGGRRAMRYSLKPDKCYILSVCMDQLFTNMVLMDLYNCPVFPRRSINLDLHRHKDALAALTEALTQYIADSKIDRDKILGVGIGMPGFVNVDKGVNYTFFRQDMDQDHRSYIEEQLGIRVFMDNDSRLTALAESTFGGARGHSNAMIINVGWGTGLGMIINGELFRGDTGYAGEFSHIPLSDNGVLCECGKKGCLETETSLYIMAQKAVQEIKKLKKHHLPVKDIPFMSDVILEAANKGDQLSIDLLSNLGYMLGKGIAILIHIMNPRLIVLSGRGSKAGKILVAPIQQALTQYCIPRLLDQITIKVSTLQQDAGIIGAAAYAMENVEIQQKKAIRPMA